MDANAIVMSRSKYTEDGNNLGVWRRLEFDVAADVHPYDRRRCYDGLPPLCHLLNTFLDSRRAALTASHRDQQLQKKENLSVWKNVVAMVFCWHVGACSFLTDRTCQSFSEN